MIWGAQEKRGTKAAWVSGTGRISSCQPPLFANHFSALLSGKSKWGLCKWGFKATLCNLRTIVYNCAQICGLFGFPSKGNLRHEMTTIVGNRGQLWTSTLSPYLQSPHLDFSALLVLSWPRSRADMNQDPEEWGRGPPAPAKCTSILGAAKIPHKERGCKADFKTVRKRKRHINKIFLLWSGSSWPSDNGPVNRTKKFMCSPPKPGK